MRKAAIVSVMQLKGGVGRSTVATNLATSLSDSGRVLLVDCDHPQFTSEDWYKLRTAKYQEEAIDLTTIKTAMALYSTLLQSVETYDFIVIDGPPRLSDISLTQL